MFLNLCFLVYISSWKENLSFLDLIDVVWGALNPSFSWSLLLSCFTFVPILLAQTSFFPLSCYINQHQSIFFISLYLGWGTILSYWSCAWSRSWSQHWTVFLPWECSSWISVSDLKWHMMTLAFACLMILMISKMMLA